MLVDGEAPGNAQVQVVEVVVIVPEVGQMEAELVVAQREVFHARTAVQIFMAGLQGDVVRNAVRVHVGGAVALIAHLGAEIPFSQALPMSDQSDSGLG